MATFTKFNIWVEDMGKELHQFATPDTLKILLTNTAPNAADTVVDTTTTPCTVKSTSNGSEIAAASGYSKGGPSLASVAWSQSSGTAKLTANAVTVTAGASIGPFRYAVLYNDSGGTTATRPLIGWWDYASSVTLASGETFTIGNSNDGSNWSSTYPILSLA